MSSEQGTFMSRPGTRDSKPALFICLLLALVTLTAFWPVRSCDFIDYDDPEYVTANPHVQAGLTTKGIAWALRSTECGNWHPLTWLSHMLDCQLYGLNPAGHHLTNLLFHIANTVLLFLVLKRMARTTWRSALVAALFALHPLHVESVAWISERKDVLSTFFFMLTLWAYVRYAEMKSEIRSPASRHPPSSIFYLLALFCFALGLMSKPMLVTLPCVLLLLDYWPLQRFQLSTLNSMARRSEAATAQPSTIPRLLWEKLPFFFLSAAFSVIAFRSQQSGGAVAPTEAFSVNERIGNALISYFRYVRKTFWPEGLAVFYPHPETWPLWQVIGAGLFLAAVSILAVCRARRHAYLLVGWLWFLGTLVPVIGLVQVGSQSMADRYTYVPLIGVFVVLVWGGGELLVRWRMSRVIIGSIATFIVIACVLRTTNQLRHWRNSETLFRHALRVTERNCVAYNILGLVLERQGRLDQAFGCYTEALRLVPNYAVTHYNLATALRLQGKRDAAITHFKEALRLQPGFALAHNGLGRMLLDGGKIDEALAHLKQALQINPDYADAHNNLGIFFIRRGQTAEAVMHFEAFLRLNPDDPDAHYNLGNVAFAQGRFEDAAIRYRAALRVRPDYFKAHHNLGMVLAALGRTGEAVAEYAAALKLQPDFAPTQYQLADVLLKQGKWEEAAKWFAAAAENKPDFAEAHYHLGLILADEGKVGEAIQRFREAVRLKPDWVEALNDLAWVLATSKEVKWRNGPEAVRLAARATELTGNRDRRVLGTLAAAYAAVGQFEDAVKTLQPAVELAESTGLKELAAEYRRQLELYQSGKPYSQ